MSEVIDATARFARRTAAAGEAEQLRISQLESDLRSRARVPFEDRMVMATTLGSIAARLDGAAPERGAQAMFRGLGAHWEAKWRKRRRLVILPGEAGPPDGVLESGGATYLALLRAAGELLAVDQSPEMRVRSWLNLLRELLRGTSMAPAVPELSETLATGGELLTEALQRAAARVGRETQLTELWRLMKRSPISVGYRPLDEEPGSSALGEAAALARGLPTDRWNGPMNLRFEADGDGDCSWAHPWLELGVLAVRREIPVFRLPEDVAPRFTYEEATDCVAVSACDWLEEIGYDFNHSELPARSYDVETRFGWEERGIWSLYDVALHLEPADDGEPACRISFREHEGDVCEVVPSIGPAFIDDHMLRQAVVDRYCTHEWLPLPGPGGARYVAIRLPSWWAGSAGRRGEVFGYFHDAYWEPQGNTGGVSEPHVAPFALAGEGMWFSAAFDLPTQMPVPLPPASLGAALLRNLASEAGPGRLDGLLLARAHQIARTGLAYHQAVVEHYRLRIRGI